MNVTINNKTINFDEKGVARLALELGGGGYTEEQVAESMVINQRILQGETFEVIHPSMGKMQVVSEGESNATG